MVCCCQSTVASGVISQDDLNSQQNYCFSADSCSPFFLGGACYIHLTMGTNAVFSGFFSLFGHGGQLYELNHFRDELSLSYLF